MIRFEVADGGITVTAEAQDARAVAGLVEQFQELLAEREAAPDRAPGPTGDPALRRLFPDPVPDDPEDSAEVRELTGPALLEHKRTNAALVARSLEARRRLDPREELAWLQWLTDIRLVLAARLGIELDGDEGTAESAADRAMRWTYHALGALQADLLEAIDARGSGTGE